MEARPENLSPTEKTEKKEEMVGPETLPTIKGPDALQAELNEISHSVDAQPQVLAHQGVALGLEPQAVEQVLTQKDYPKRLQALRDKIRRTSEALTVALALGVPAMAQASQEEVATRPMDQAAPTSVEPQTERVQSKIEIPAEGATILTATPELLPEENGETPKDTKDEAEPEIPTLTEDEGRGLGLTEEEITEQIKSKPKASTEIQEPQKENAEKKAEIMKGFSEERFEVYQDLVLTIMQKGAASPEAFKKLSTLLGKEIKENKGAIAERMVTKVAPYYDSVKTLFEAMKGSTFKGEELKGFERFKHFAQGAFGLALDTSQLGSAGKLIHKLSKAARMADTAETVIDFATILREIQANPNDPKILEKVTKLIEKKTLVEKAKEGIEDKARTAYERGEIAQAEMKKERKNNPNENFTYGHE